MTVRAARGRIPRRRLLTAVALAALAVVALAGCRAQPGVAAYVDGNRYTEDRVSAIYDDARDKLNKAVNDQQAAQAKAAGQPLPSATSVSPPVTRQQVVDLLVSIDLGKRAAASRNYQVKSVTDAATLASVLRLPSDAEYVRLWTQWNDVRTALVTNLPPATLTAADVETIYQSLIKAQVIRPDVPADQIREAIKNEQVLRKAMALSNALAQTAKATSTTVNPRYLALSAPMVLSTQQGPAFYDLPYIPSDSPVRNVG